MNHRKRRIYEVLEGAKDCKDEIVIAACRRLIWADTLGWKRHAKQSDIDLVFGIYQ